MRRVFEAGELVAAGRGRGQVGRELAFDLVEQLVGHQPLDHDTTRGPQRGLDLVNRCIAGQSRKRLHPDSLPRPE